MDTPKRLLLFMAIAALSACGGGQGSAPVSNSSQSTGSKSTSVSTSLSPAAAVGKLIFNDISLSASGAESCATCHSPNNAHAQVNILATQLGGANLDQRGLRAPPSLNYLSFTPAPSVDSKGNPVGGFDWDGRAASLALQAQGPLLTSFEMGNATPTDVVNKLMQATYANQFMTVFGTSIFDSTDNAFQSLLYALQQYQIEGPEFHPFNSKYDLYLAGTVTLSPAEANGLALFNNPAKGNCFQCHPGTTSPDGSAPLFTNFTYANLGVPRNPTIPDNSAPNFYDLGVCGPLRTDLATQTKLCGSFKTPTLRNVATRKVFFHNGVFTDLTSAVTFLLDRDTAPASWYPQNSSGSIQIYNDVPSTMTANVDTTDAPFNHPFGSVPALSAAEISDLVQFLGTLTDNYQTTE